MPRGNGAGPSWKGGSRRGKGSGRMRGTSPGAGPSGECVCPNCGARTLHQAGIPCYELSCPKCGAKMMRD